MKLENFDIELNSMTDDLQVTFTWEDDSLTFYVLANYGIDYSNGEVCLGSVIQSECWSEVEPITKFVLSDIMLDYLEEELLNYQRANPSFFSNDYLDYWI